MEKLPERVNTIGQIITDYAADRKSRFWQIDNHPNLRSEVICPKPCRATRVPYFINALNQTGSKIKGDPFVSEKYLDLPGTFRLKFYGCPSCDHALKGLPLYRVDCSPEILDLIWTQDDPDCDPDVSNQVGFFHGTPPVRTNNPIVNDVEFVKQAQALGSPQGNSPGIKQAGRIELGSPNCRSSFGGSPKERIEGFACVSSEKHCVSFGFA